MDFIDIKRLYQEHEESLRQWEGKKNGDILGLLSLREIHLTPEVNAEVECFKHIVEKICVLWWNPVAFDRYIDSLMICDRPEGRQWFPTKVMNEILAVQQLHKKIVGGKEDYVEEVDIWAVAKFES